jgi:hypothetical protein
MTGGTKGGPQRASSLRPRCVGEVDPETATRIYLSRDFYVELIIEVVVLGQIFYRVLRFSPVSIISSFLKTYI